MPTLAELLSQCEDDTRAICGAAAASRLRRWRQLPQDDEPLAAFVQRTIRKQQGRANGFRLHCAGRLSLEAIVLNHRPELFSDDDRRVARETLGIRNDAA